MALFIAFLRMSYATTAITCNQQQSETASDIYSIQSCYFFGFFSSTYGGAILIDTNTANLTAQSSIFSSCGAATSGGAFYFQGINADMERICGSDCYTSRTAQFFYVYLTSSSTSVLLESSMLRCSNSTLTGPYDCFHLWYGNQTISNFNSSMNQVTSWGGGFLPCVPDPLNSIFVTIINCTGGDGLGTIRLYETVTGTFSYANVVGNSGAIIVDDSGTTSIMMCVFIGNNGTLFVGGTVSKCWIAHSGTIGGSSIFNCSYVTQPTFIFNHQSQKISGVVCYIQSASRLFCSSSFSHEFAKFGVSPVFFSSFIVSVASF